MLVNFTRENIICFTIIIAVVAEMVYLVNNIIRMVVNTIHGRKVRRRRIRAGLSLAELGSFSGIPAWKIDLIERGDTDMTKAYKVLLRSIKNYGIGG